MRWQDLRSGVGGVASAAFAVACCLAPILLAGVGLGGLVGISLMRYQWPLTLVGTVLLGISYYAYFREKRRCAIEGCQMAGSGLNLLLLCMSSLIILILILGLIFPSETYQILTGLAG